MILFSKYFILRYSIIIALIVIECLELIMVYETNKYSNIIQLISQIYGPFILSLMLFLPYIVYINTPFDSKDIFFAFIIAFFTRDDTLFKNKYSKSISYIFVSCTESLGIFISLIVSTLFIGRKIRFEINVIIITLFALCAIGVCIDKSYFDTGIMLLGAEYILLSGFRCILAHMIAANHSTCKSLLYSACIVTFFGRVNISDIKFAELSDEIFENKVDSAILLFIFISRVVLEYIVFKLFDIDVYFISKIPKLAVSAYLSK